MDASRPLFKPDGTLNFLSDEELKQADETNRVLCFSDGTLADGTPYWAYIAVLPSKHATFLELTRTRQPLRLTDFGEMIAAGYEETVPEDIQQEMQEKYKFNGKYLNELNQKLIACQQEFKQKQEDNRLMDIVAMMKKGQK